MTPTELRDVAWELADLADAITLPAFRGVLEVRTKGDGTWVTDVDVAVEQRLRSEIIRRLPGHAFLGEEDGLTGDPSAPTWIVDPIDGTTNFVRGNPIFATLIAVAIDDVEVAGVVSAPALGSRWDGAVGAGARQDGRPIAVSERDRLDQAEVAFGDLECFLDEGLEGLVETMTRVTARQRGYGDFWQHCLVAQGSTDIALEARVSRWDLAAVRAVVEAAGGRFTSLDGHATAAAGSAVSTNRRLHDEVLALVAAARDAGGHDADGRDASICTSPR